MVQTSVQKRLLNFYCGKLLLTETTTCFSICERERCWRRKYCFVSRGEQIIGVLHFWISLEFSLVAKCNVSSIKKSTSSKVVYDPVSVDVKNFSPKQTSSLKGAGWGDPDPPGPSPWICHWINTLFSYWPSAHWHRENKFIFKLSDRNTVSIKSRN